MSDFLSFIDVELLRFFHGAIHLFIIYADNIVWQCGYCDHFVAMYVNVYVGVCVWVCQHNKAKTPDQNNLKIGIVVVLDTFFRSLLILSSVGQVSGLGL